MLDPYKIAVKVSNVMELKKVVDWYAKKWEIEPWYKGISLSDSSPSHKYVYPNSDLHSFQWGSYYHLETNYTVPSHLTPIKFNEWKKRANSITIPSQVKWVQCIDNTKCDRIQNGKEYEVIEETKTTYLIRINSGFVNAYKKERFRIIDKNKTDVMSNKIDYYKHKKTGFKAFQSTIVGYHQIGNLNSSSLVPNSIITSGADWEPIYRLEEEIITVGFNSNVLVGKNKIVWDGENVNIEDLKNLSEIKKIGRYVIRVTEIQSGSDRIPISDINKIINTYDKLNP